jgi:hypothetical protein
LESSFIYSIKEKRALIYHSLIYIYVFSKFVITNRSAIFNEIMIRSALY